MTRLARNTVLVTLLVALAAPAATTAQSPSSDEGALFLLLPVGAKAVSLGRAMTAMPGSESVFWNPAGLGGLEGSRVVLLRGDYFAGQATAISSLFARPGLGTLGASYFLLDAGDQDVTDGQGIVVGRLSGRQHLGVASAAAALSSQVSAGVSFKLIQLRLSCRGDCLSEGATATTYAVDAGVQLHPSAPFRVGAAVVHLGPDFQARNAEQADPLPARMRLALAYDLATPFVAGRDIAAWLALEVEDRVHEPGSVSMYVGSELVAGGVDALFLRAGYGWGQLDQDDGVRVGLGLRYDSFDLSIAKSLEVSPLTQDNEPIHVTFSYVF